MCWLLLAIGVAMLIIGSVLVVRFFSARGANAPETAGSGRTETMILGAMLASVGLLLGILGTTGALCARFGIG
ncbi:MAG: hypothetical protein U5J97_07945 [Trueperaceae bacterium]|nr:hypothetical protein [Trueperaceae bacterium]